MNGINLAVRIQVRRLSRREEHESFIAGEEAVDIVVEIVMLRWGCQFAFTIMFNAGTPHQSGRRAVF